MSAYTFYSLAFGIIAGVFVSSLYPVSFFVILFVSLLAFFLGIFPLISRVKSDARIFVVFSIFLLAFSLGALRYEIVAKDTDNYLAKGPALFGGIIEKEPEFREKNVHVVVEIENSSVLLFAPSGTEYEYGDRVQFFGEIVLPENFDTDNGRVFNYREFLKARGVDYVVYNPKVTVLGKGEGNPLRSTLYKIKNNFLDSINENLPLPESGLLAGILLGEKGALTKEVEESFRLAGLSHVVVLSGYNIAIVVIFVGFIFSFLGAKLRIVASTVAIFLFVLLTGAEVTAIRASLMAYVVLLAKYIKRNYAVGRALVFVAILMILQNPKILVFDISFQLSFLATLGIVYLNPILEKFFSFLTNFSKMREIVATTISAQILVTPLILYQIGTFSFISLPANILVLPLIPLAMLSGFIVAILGMISHTLALPFVFISYALLHISVQVATFFGDLPFSVKTIEPFSAWWLLPAYLFLFITIYLLHRIYSKRLSN